MPVDSLNFKGIYKVLQIFVPTKPLNFLRNLAL